MVSEAEGGRVPLTLRGPARDRADHLRTPVASAQIKSAVLLAGLNAPGLTTVIEREATRDHTERMLRHFGAEVAVDAARAPTAGASRSRASRSCAAPTIVVPADPSSAAFPLVAALIVPGSDIVIEGVMMNPLRTGLITTLLEMGADIERLNERDEGGEEVADLRVRASRLKGVDVPAGARPSMIDEYPILAVAAAFAEGTTRMRGPARTAGQGIRPSRRRRGRARGGRRRARDRGRRSHRRGRGAGARAAARVATHLDHRIAMAFLVMGLATPRAGDGRRRRDDRHELPDLHAADARARRRDP